MPSMTIIDIPHYQHCRDLCRFYDRMQQASTKQRDKIFANFLEQVIPQQDAEAWQIYRCSCCACSKTNAVQCSWPICIW